MINFRMHVGKIKYYMYRFRVYHTHKYDNNILLYVWHKHIEFQYHSQTIYLNRALGILNCKILWLG